MADTQQGPARGRGRGRGRPQVNGEEGGQETERQKQRRLLDTDPHYRHDTVQQQLSRGELGAAVHVIAQYRLYAEFPLQPLFDHHGPTDGEALALIAQHELQQLISPLPYFTRLVESDLVAAAAHYARLKLAKYFPGAVDPTRLLQPLVEGGHGGMAIGCLGRDQQCTGPLLELLTIHDPPLARLYAVTLDTTPPPHLLAGPLAMPPLHTLLVANEEGVATARDWLLGGHVTRVGIDTETQPCFRKGQFNPTALMQIGTDTCIVVLDLVEGMGPSMAALICDLLGAGHITKLGVSLKQDLVQLKKSYPEYTFVLANHVDVSQLFSSRYPGMQRPSLRKLCAYAHGALLSKAQQMTNWARRPLTEAQLQYAMLDAWCLLGVFDALANTNTHVATDHVVEDGATPPEEGGGRMHTHGHEGRREHRGRGRGGRGRGRGQSSRAPATRF